MPKTYEPIATYTVTGSSVADVTFSGISGTYTDLILIAVPSVVSSIVDIFVQVGNGSVDTGTNYSRTLLKGNGSSATSTRSSNINYIRAMQDTGANTTFNTNMIFHFMNYSNTTTNKTVLSRVNNASQGLDQGVHLWRSLVAINIIKIYNPLINIAVGSTFTLYGIKAA
jgi:hypothetical protein